MVSSAWTLAYRLGASATACCSEGQPRSLGWTWGMARCGPASIAILWRFTSCLWHCSPVWVMRANARPGLVQMCSCGCRSRSDLLLQLPGMPMGVQRQQPQHTTAREPAWLQARGCSACQGLTVLPGCLSWSGPLHPMPLMPVCTSGSGSLWPCLPTCSMCVSHAVNSQ